MSVTINSGTRLPTAPRDNAGPLRSSAPDLFLSFASEHKALVDPFRAHAQTRLTMLSFDDCDAANSDDVEWKHHAEQLIRACAATLCLVGRSTHHSAPVDWEIRKTIALGKPVIAVYLEPTELVPAALSEIGVAPLPLNVDVLMDALK